MKNTKDNHLSPSSYFAFAKPIWKCGTSSLLNSICLFSCELSYKGKAKITITARNSYRIALNGRFLAFGPARSAHGYARVDEIDLGELQGNETLIIECAAYNTKTYCTLTSLASCKPRSKMMKETFLPIRGRISWLEPILSAFAK